ncbi:hypothetical protein EI613_32930 (plasmid) [Azospirillum sp. 412522]|nr:hypothetical protein [Azospirillum sp. 412522]MBY6266650.1 hypothetical protein [Azospirillum sp. 412522]
MPCVTTPSGANFDTHTRQTEIGEWRIIDARQAPEDSVTAHLDFAQKHGPLNLPVLKAAFAEFGSRLRSYVLAAPIGSTNRRAWYLYEWLTGHSSSRPT